RRLEAIASTGNDATHRAAVRATDTLGGVGIELAGNVQTSDVLPEQSAAAARIDRDGDHDHLRLVGGYSVDHAGIAGQSFTTDDRSATYGGAWTAWRAAGRFELEAFGEQSHLRDQRAVRALDLDTSSQRARVSFSSRRLAAFGLEHELAAGASLAQA